MEFSHYSVMLSECIEGLDIKPDGIYIDGTCGGAGHSSEIAKRLTEGGLLLGIDRDPDAIAVATERLAPYSAKVLKGNFSDMKALALAEGVEKVDGVLLDLGVSSHQLDTLERGFSYHGDAPLDMRMSQEGISAKDIVNNSSYAELSRILWEYGEEKFSRKIADTIIKRREIKPIETTSELADIICSSVPAKFRREKNPCKKSFQAIRIAVNCELEELNRALDDAFDMLKPGGRLCIITFHSLEDRIVKQRFASFCKGCTCPPDFPVCVCGNKPRGRLVNRKPIEATEEELAANNRSHSAKLRIIEKSDV
ncbi:MAG: 16S rRNA (cytosine(1402)-N(4))-methyltransferase RsmH [Oscillospiraceae bacterium]|nr:16S rRNA (cytosine(1402)-N(4))-methyltransferase RsmH [Oscillospiraceae bacterium]